MHTDPIELILVHEIPKPIQRSKRTLNIQFLIAKSILK
jgi:hypothetical protein